MHWLKITEAGIYLAPHNSKEFTNAEELAKWLIEDLAGSEKGVYDVASAYYWRKIISGSVCLFHKDKLIVGEGRLVDSLLPYSGGETSPETGIRYAGEIHFDPTSIRVFGKHLSFAAVEKLLGKRLTWRSIQKLTSGDYDLIQKVV